MSKEIQDEHDTKALLSQLPESCRISVVIPCRNERAHITACVDSLFKAQLEAHSLRVIVVDGMSDDGTRELLSSLINEYSSLEVLDNIERTTPYALNIGLQAFPFDIGIILGAHATVAPDFLVQNAAVLQNDASVGCAGGVITNEYNSSTAAHIGMAMSQPFGVGNAYFRTGAKTGFVDTVGFGAYRKEVFDTVGYFDDDLARNQDDEFNFRVTEAGFKIKLDTAIRTNYVVRSSYSKLYKQYWQYGFWKVFVNVKHKQVTTLRQVIPALWILFLIFGGLASLLASAAFGYLFLLGCGAYLLAAVVSASRAAGSIAGFFGVLWSFLILHFSYGLGYLRGIIWFFFLGKGPSAKSQELSR